MMTKPKPKPPEMVEGLFAIAAALDRVAEALHALGMNHACGPGAEMGAIERLAYEVKGGFSQLNLQLQQPGLNLPEQD
jgi:hypothetical protein